MYKIGDKIVYPLYGAGVIEDLEDKEIDGQLQTYYVLSIPVGNLKLMISSSKAETHNVRTIHSKEDILEKLEVAAESVLSVPDNWNQRYKENMERIKTGDLILVASVYRNLLLRERERGLSTAEKKMMTTAKQIIISEIILSLCVEKTDAEQVLDNIFK